MLFFSQMSLPNIGLAKKFVRVFHIGLAKKFVRGLSPNELFGQSNTYVKCNFVFKIQGTDSLPTAHLPVTNQGGRTTTKLRKKKKKML